MPSKGISVTDPPGTTGLWPLSLPEPSGMFCITVLPFSVGYTSDGWRGLLFLKKKKKENYH